MRDAAAAVSAQGAVVWDCSVSQEIRHHPDAGRLIAWAQAGALLAAKERLGKARQGIKTRKPPPKKLVGARLAKAREAWPDTARSVASIADELGVSSRTLYRAVEQGKLPKRGET